MKAYVNAIDKFSERTGSLISWVSFILVLVVCYDVFTRYILKESSVALQELEWHLFALLFLIAAPYTLLKDEHVRVDVLYTKFSPKGKAWVNLAGSLLFLIPFCILIIISVKEFVLQSFIFRETSPNPGGLPARYIIKAVIPISFLLLLLEGISLAFKSLLNIKKDK